ncbi:hypothetical protein [Pseudomonas soli]|uniref:hypothetical protein n=1 Tax=Pseudomonas soli TaxID=1306993 RepID=UPI000F507A7A
MEKTYLKICLIDVRLARILAVGQAGDTRYPWRGPDSGILRAQFKRLRTWVWRSNVAIHCLGHRRIDPDGNGLGRRLDTPRLGNPQNCSRG